MAEEGNIIEEPIDLDEYETADPSLRLDVFQHMRVGVNNRNLNCICDNSLDKLFYCVPCKVSCCTKCTLPDHKPHLLIKKDDYDLKPDKIQKSFDSIENTLEGDLYKNLEDKRRELLNEIEETYQKIENLAAKWRDEKMAEINGLLDDLTKKIQEIDKKKKDVKRTLNDFATKHKKFSGLRNKNKDPHNTLFLIAYDLLNINYNWSNSKAEIGESIQKNMEDYKELEKEKNADNVQKIHDILFLERENYQDPKSKLDKKLQPLVKLKIGIKDFNADKLNDIDRRIAKINKTIDQFKGSVLGSVKRFGDYKELARENNIFEHRKVKGADNLFSQRRLDGVPEGDENLLVPSHPIKSKGDVILDNPVLNKNFTHVLTDLYDTYFRIPTIELQSSHADLKIRDEEEQQMNSVKIIEGTNQVNIYDKKLKKIFKKTLKLTKNPHGYTKFPFGCRAVLLGDKLYITGGKDEFREYAICLIYDKKKESIKRIMDMKNPRSYHTMIFNRVFETMMVIGGEFNDTVEIFDPLTNRWQQLPELNIPRSIPLFYFDEGRGNMYVLFGVEGDYRKSNYTNTIEILDLTEIEQGWMKINYNNRARMDFKCFMNLYPLNDYLVLLYGAIENRSVGRNACVYNLVKSEMDKIDKNLLDELRAEAKTSKLLDKIVTSVSKSSISELAENSKTIK